MAATDQAPPYPPWCDPYPLGPRPPKDPWQRRSRRSRESRSSTPPPADAICTLASLKRIAKTEANKAVLRLWRITAPASYQELQIQYRPSLLTLKRQAMGRILAARSHHGDFADYHIRFNHTDATLTCSCGKRKSPLHFFFCRKGKATKTLSRRPPSEAIPWLLGSAAGTERLAEWLSYTEFYQKICLPH